MKLFGFGKQRRKTGPIETKHNAILSGEKSLANAVVRTVLPPPGVGVWEVMMPILFIFKQAQYRNARDVFLQNMLYTKTLALSAAAQIASGHDSQAVWEKIESKTRRVLASVDQGIYSEEIRAKQLYEVKLLAAHYAQLIRATGTNYRELVSAAYPDRHEFESFFNSLATAEKETMAAAAKTLGDQANHQMANKIESAIRRLRERLCVEIYTVIP
jgi:hypothetical protein